MKPAVVLITGGASSGLGLATAEHLRKVGHTVYAASRSLPDNPADRHLRLDVNDDDSVRRAVASIVEREGRVDVAVNAAGFGIVGPVEHTSVEEAKEQFETNFFGTLRVCRAVLPHMRRQASGLIVNVSSIGGMMGLPYQGLYSASKFAVEGYTESLRMEVARFGVRVVLVEPGDFRTRFTENRRATREPPDEAYAAQTRAAVAVISRDEQAGWAPEKIARLVERLIDQRSPRLRYTIGPFTERLAAALRLVLPFKLFARIMLAHYESAPSGSHPPRR